MKQKLIHILLNQYVIAGVIALFIIFSLPDNFSKYKVELVSQNIAANSRIYFEDLDSDNISEKIMCRNNTAGQASFMVLNSYNDLIDQWNFSGEFIENNGKILSFFDTNNDGNKEVSLITRRNDSAFLNIVEPLAKKGINRQQIFIDTLVIFNNEYFVSPSYTKILSTNHRNELVFTLSAGYSGYPRNVYKYNFDDNKISKSPHITNRSIVEYVIDINNNGFYEIILRNNSSGNKIDSSYTKRTDNSSWLTILDKDLNFLFEPIEFKSTFSGLRILLFKDNNNYNILALVNSKQYDDFPDKMFIFSNKGVLLKEKEVPSGQYQAFLNSNKDSFILYDRIIGELKNFNFNLELISSLFIESKGQIAHIDIDGDGNSEWINISNKSRDVTIYRHDFKDEISFVLPKDDDSGVVAGLKQISVTKNHLFFQKGDDYFIYDYFKNPYFAFQYLVYLGIFMSVLSLILLVLRGQKIRLEKQQAIANEISELQIKTIKNQVDPHFVFNAINTISEMTLMDNKLEADRFISHFSKFMRNTLMHSDKISTTLKEELDYVENFIKLQRIRYCNKFDYNITISKSVDVKATVPKHVLFTYVENAIKHGLALKEKGLLQIVVKIKKGKLFLSIADNGLGMRPTQSNEKDSTGSGLGIMEQIYDLYAKLYKRKISHRIIEIIDAENNKAGLRVEVLIDKNKIK